MINSIMEKAAEADPCCGVPQWAKDNVPELYDEVMASFHALQQPFDDKDLDGVRAAARRYGVAFRAVLNAYEADRAESGTQLDLVTA
ncbi:hypothetical protein [Desulfuromonas acetoxidans]|uniref:hypothetical protein n=1 Tax=Desulfuromonas acetoxidans TaxID=891 RepID=UPI0029316C4E|nr:hypothetical protein [Desulfuromonas acetoxidans]